MARQVAIYLPDRGHLAYGVVRVIVSDANDTGGRWAEPTFMDSDGTLGNDAGGRKAKHAGEAPSCGWEAPSRGPGWEGSAVSLHCRRKVRY